MAKGQKRSSREIRKSKRAKVSPKVEGSFGAQMKQAANAAAPGGKSKG